MTRVLLIDDDPRLRDVMSRGLQAEGFEVDLAPDGRTGLREALSGRYALIILDLGLPDMDGLTVCGSLRARGCTSGVLMLTARDALADRVAGLGEGADDYLIKPFAFEELLARMQALLRRGRVEPDVPALAAVGDLRLDRGARRVFKGEREISLTAREFALLDRLMQSAGSAVSRATLLRDVWSLQIDPGTKVVEVYVRYLRSKLDTPGEPSPIQTVRGYGYGVGLPAEALAE